MLIWDQVPFFNIEGSCKNLEIQHLTAIQPNGENGGLTPINNQMPYFALTYEVIDDFVNKRTPFRPSHLKEVRDAQARGELVMAGALGEPVGALLIFRAADKSTVENFVKADPYVKEGLVKAWTVRPWTVVVGQDPAETPPGVPN